MAEGYRPYSDGQMNYDGTRHRYTLTAEYLLNECGIDLDTTLAGGNSADRGRNPALFLRRVSDLIYAAVFASTPYRNAAERALALRPEYREVLRDAMVEQSVYILQNGDISAYTGIDAVSMQAVDPLRMSQARIAPLAMDLLVSAGVVRLGYVPGRDIAPDYAGEGY